MSQSAVGLILLLTLTITDAKTRLHLGVLHPLSNGFATRAAEGYLQCAMMAVRDINQHQDILRDYQLETTVMDTKHSASYSTKQFFELVSKPPTKIVIFGAVQSTNCEAVAAIAKYWNLVQVSHSAISMKLGDRKEYPYFYRTAISDYSYNPATIALMKHFNWKRIAIIAHAKDMFFYAAKDLRSRALKANIQILTSETFTENANYHVTQIKSKNAKIIVVQAYPLQILQVLCAAYQNDMYGPRYVWFLPGWLYSNWFFDNYDSNIINCTKADIGKVLEGYFAFKGVILPEIQQSRLSGYTTKQFLTEYKNFGPKYHLTGSYTYAYDAIWSIALALNKTDEILKKKYSRSLADFHYNDTLTRSIILNSLANTSFVGISGKIAFEDGNRVGNVRIMQYQSNSYINYTVEVGFYDVFKDSISFNTTKYKVEWQGEYVPVDHTKIIFKLLNIGPEAFTVFAVLASLGIIISIFLMIYNINMRSIRQVKITSPKINVLMLFGCILCYIAVILFGLDNSMIAENAVTYTCTAAVWSLCVGFTLGFGSLFWKTWRVYTIYKHKHQTRKRTMIRDKHIIPRLLVFVIVDLIILICWEIIDPIHTVTNTLPLKITSVSGDSRTIQRTMICTSHHMSIWLVVLYAYKFLMMIFGAFLAWETRSVHIREINDSKLIGISIYNVSLLCTVAVILHQFANTTPRISYALVSTFIVFCTTVSICVIFIPMIRNVREGKEIASYNLGVKQLSAVNQQHLNLENVSGTASKHLMDELETQLRLVKQMKQYMAEKGIPFEEHTFYTESANPSNSIL